jgi:hypothetical protein
LIGTCSAATTAAIVELVRLIADAQGLKSK